MCHKCFSFFCLTLTALTDCKIKAEKVDVNDRYFEGYVQMNVRTVGCSSLNIADYDDGVKSDSILLMTDRRMYLLNDCLIDIIGNDIFNHGKYVKTDTLSFDFYDLSNQKYVRFGALSTEANVIKRGNMSDDGSFSNKEQFDPMNGVADSAWQVHDTVIGGIRTGIIGFLLKDIPDSLNRALAEKARCWVNYELKKFLLQLSYLLSGKFRDGFVYETESAFPGGNRVMIKTLDYRAAKLNDTFRRIFERWRKIARE